MQREMTLKEAIIAGKKYAQDWRKRYIKFPEDEWDAIAKNWDINLWINGDEDDKLIKLTGTIYPVITDSDGIGHTDCTVFYRVWEQEVPSDD